MHTVFFEMNLKCLIKSIYKHILDTVSSQAAHSPVEINEKEEEVSSQFYHALLHEPFEVLSIMDFCGIIETNTARWLAHKPARRGKEGLSGELYWQTPQR